MPAPKFTHYVSLFNNGVYPAQSGGAVGYEDEHMTEWRPANADEIAKYERGDIEVQIKPIEMLASAPPAPVQPMTIQLADEDEPTPVIVNPATLVAEAPIAPVAPPVVVAAPAAPVAPAAPAPVIPPAAT